MNLIIVVILYAIGIPATINFFKKSRYSYKTDRYPFWVMLASVIMGAIILLESSSFGLKDLLYILSEYLIMFNLAIRLLRAGFRRITKVRDSKSIEFIYHLGISITLLLCCVMASENLNRYAFSLSFSLSRSTLSLMMYDTTRDKLLHLCIILLCECVGVAGTYIYALILNKLKEAPSVSKVVNHKDYSLDPKMRKHYTDRGLTEDQIKYFRNQMATARDRINRLQITFRQTAKLKAIEDKHSTIEVCQAYFQAIVNEPERLADASNFIVTYLPSLEDLVDKYNEISQHVAKNKQTYVILEKSAQAINDLCIEISQDYINFHKSTYEDLEDEVTFVNRNIHGQE